MRATRTTLRGMTLLEVVLTAALLLGIFALAAPSFTGNRVGAEARARAAVSSSLNAQVVLRERTGDYSTDATALNKLTPRITHQSGASTGPTRVSVATGQATLGGVTVDVVGVAVLDEEGSCWVGKITAAARGGFLYAVDSTPPACSGGFALTVSADPSQPGRGASPTEPLEL